MKRLLPFLFVLIFSCAALAQTSQTVTTQNVDGPRPHRPRRLRHPATSSSPQERMFFPKDWYWGWAQFDLAPPHNEIDPNLCAANAGAVRRRQRAVQRVCPLHAFRNHRDCGRSAETCFRRVMFFFDPNFLFGKNVPQTLYTWSWERDWHGVRLGRGRRPAKALRVPLYRRIPTWRASDRAISR